MHRLDSANGPSVETEPPGPRRTIPWSSSRFVPTIISLSAMPFIHIMNLSMISRISSDVGPGPVVGWRRSSMNCCGVFSAGLFIVPRAYVPA
jgi:hypothetical protein